MTGRRPQLDAPRPTPISREFHHRVPLCQGGAHSLDNIETLCVVCHKRAHGALGLSRHA